ncbi:MAG: hypothetical protein AVDCRST_MAG23-493 [uncultured Sphingosinicella sp.]|uniref:Uncharacterized protein n=1 Tax=uncultured Sphingosinicella sp. TaxID=478748 RepID=A0A6J4TKP7_9SPHN|nr:MAG: hypothetical protein AVDCRST_MAG23-493 [uncultured Sphingosinicella sp.]
MLVAMLALGSIRARLRSASWTKIVFLNRPFLPSAFRGRGAPDEG